MVLISVKYKKIIWMPINCLNYFDNLSYTSWGILWVPLPPCIWETVCTASFIPPSARLVKQGRTDIKESNPWRQNVPEMSWSNICSTVSSSSQRDAPGWTWETKVQSLFEAHARAARRQKASLETALAAAKEEGNLFIIQPLRVREGERRKRKGERRASAQKSPDKTHYEAAMKDE